MVLWVELVRLYVLLSLDKDSPNSSCRLHRCEVICQSEQRTLPTALPEKLSIGVCVAYEILFFFEKEAGDDHVDDRQDEAVDAHAEQTVGLRPIVYRQLTKISNTYLKSAWRTL